MKIVAHRGLPEKIDGPGANTLADYARAFKYGLDVEMDVRFHGRRVLCSHDPIDDSGPIAPELRYPTFEDFCHELRKAETCRAFVNVKCDGMTGFVRDIAVKYGVLDRIVTFDHSMPDFLHAEKHYPDVVRARRAGPWEVAIGVQVRNAPWVWLDPIALGPQGMASFILRRVKRYYKINEQVRIVIVSPEIHLKDPNVLAEVNMPGLAWDLARLPGIYGVLTDQPTFYGLRT